MVQTALCASTEPTDAGARPTGTHSPPPPIRRKTRSRSRGRRSGWRTKRRATTNLPWGRRVPSSRSTPTPIPVCGWLITHMTRWHACQTQSFETNLHRPARFCATKSCECALAHSGPLALLLARTCALVRWWETEFLSADATRCTCPGRAHLPRRSILVFARENAHSHEETTTKSAGSVSSSRRS